MTRHETLRHMCGIFAYVGDKEAAALLITALKRLEPGFSGLEGA